MRAASERCVGRAGGRSSRRGFTLVEVLLATLLAGVLLTMAWSLWSSAERQGLQVEEVSEVMSAALVLQEAISWDLQRSLPAQVRQWAEQTRGELATELRLPVFAGYEGGSSSPQRFREVRYEYDRIQRRVLRDGVPLVALDLDSVAFEWSRQAPLVLRVRVIRRAAAHPLDREVRFLVPAPGLHQDLDPWVPASWHREVVEAL